MEEYKMNVQDLNIEGLTEKEFHQKVTRMMNEVRKFAMRGREELGYNVALVNVLGVQTDDENEVVANDMSFGTGDMFLTLALQTKSLGRVVDVYKQYEMAEFLSGLFDEEDEDNE